MHYVYLRGGVISEHVEQKLVFCILKLEHTYRDNCKYQIVSVDPKCVVTICKGTSELVQGY